MQEIKQENTEEITIDFTKQINESYLRAIGYQIEYLLKSMFGGSFLPVKVSGTKEQVSAFARALGNEKRYIDCNDGGSVELYNNGNDDIDLSSGWALQRWTNGNVDPQSPKPLTGSIAAGGFFIICNDADKFNGFYGLTCDQDIGTGGAADSNGDDNIALLDASGARRTFIHPRCKELIKSLRTLTYTPHTGLPNKNLGVDHAFDAFGYLCLQQFNLAKPETLGQTSYRIY